MKIMQNIGIITKKSDPGAWEATKQLALWLYHRGKKVTICSETAEAIGLDPEVAQNRPQDDLPEGQDMVVVIGGDGTFLAGFRAIGTREIPLLGINMGRLGFLTEVPSDAMFETMEEVFAGHYRVESRTLLNLRVLRHGEEIFSHCVMNDVVLHKGTLARMIEFQVAIDDQFVYTARADGLILATPTGSTAYALSAGGPIIHPGIDALLLTPICPHTLTNRPIAVPGYGEISITFPGRGGFLDRHPEQRDRLLTLDGQTGFSLMDADQVLVKRSEHRLQVLHAPNRNYYAVLREKLHWGEQIGS
ncbi:NAD(+)/NADH kinase [Candidatus Magnetaquicoccus inordinatus]|uniref:NAD(+)/NADH kinase n=1 Tax=Candidatus Magnetaquicoccus inordinatus TaxID=2496818 RepID=UPI00187D4918|nr:NAD(+)/NADH kinase [Candidatus Magnetaquicoccus inordinatus]